MMQPQELVELVAAYHSGVDEEKLTQAYHYAQEKHKLDFRESGEPYFTHPLEVAHIVTQMRLDPDSVIAALLHDTIEDTDATREEIDHLFGENIGRLVEGLTKIKRINLVSKKTRQGENLRRLLMAIADDVRILLVKLADRLHNMRTLTHVPLEKRERISQETMDIYAPLAGRMGMQDMRDELEEMAFQNLHPDAYNTVNEKLEKSRDKVRTAILEIEQSVVENLAQAGIKALVKSRSKRAYSVFRKMEKNNVSFEQLTDLIGFRVIVEKVEECYQAVGVIHQRWPAVPGRFKDYISTPKQNDYRSIHTTVVGPSHQRVELQIRTHKMNAIAEQGIAAHTLYKDGIYSAPDDINTASDSRSYGWLRQTVEIFAKGDHDHPDEVLEQAKLELFLDQVFCFTPKGRLIALPQGATVIDFAYAVHTNIGNSCVGCRVNGKAVPVASKLSNGDEVQIIRADDHIPSPVWETIAITGKARAGIRRATRAARTKQYSGFGKSMLTTTFKRAGRKFDIEKLDLVLDKLAHTSTEEMIAAVGRGELQPDDVLKAVYPDYKQERRKRKTKVSGEGWFNLSGVTNIMFRIPGRKRSTYAEDAKKLTSTIPFRGTKGDMPVKLDPECGAVPGDRIVGIVTPGVGVTVYPIQAAALEQYEDSANDWLDLRWDIDEENPERFLAKINLLAIDVPGTLAEITEVIANTDSNIANLYIAQPESGLAQMIFGVEVWDLNHLNRLIREIRALSVVSHVERLNL